MPVTPTYPGVYIEEIPSGVRTITGVATSITAFIGRALRGPVNEPVPISSFAEFERIFGGLWVDSPTTYAVRDFYGNGGSQAIIVRLFEGLGPNAYARIQFEGHPNIKLRAVDPGTWGNALRATIDPDVSDDAAKPFEKHGLSKDDLLNLTISEGETEETFVNLSFKEGPRRIDRVLEAQSRLVRWAGGKLDVEKDEDLPQIPNEEVTDDLTKAEKEYKEKVATIETDLEKLQDELAELEAAEPQDQDAIDAKKQEIADKKQEKADDYKALTQKQKALAGADSQPLVETSYLGDQAKKEGLYALEDADLFNLLCIPPDTREGDTADSVYQQALTYCNDRRAMLIVDPKLAWGQAEVIGPSQANQWLAQRGLFGTDARNAALYFPHVIQADPLRDRQLETLVPCGIIAGVMARTDVQRGVWKAPAGIDAALSGVQGLQVNLTDAQNGDLNQRGINCLRSFPVYGRVVWGARTVRGADQLADEYKYVPVRRLALFIEESLYRGTQWVVFEPNDEPLWAQIRLNVGAFMHNLFRQGAFQGASPNEAYFVKCDSETNPQYDIDRGIVNIVVGFAPLKPAEFVIIKIQQIAKQAEL
jgi:phage tail sheath protein FI